MSYFHIINGLIVKAIIAVICKVQWRGRDGIEHFTFKGRFAIADM